MGALALRRTKATPGAGGGPLVALTPETTLLVEASDGPRGAAIMSPWACACVACAFASACVMRTVQAAPTNPSRTTTTIT
jgi:hypothetical protein